MTAVKTAPDDSVFFFNLWTEKGAFLVREGKLVSLFLPQCLPNPLPQPRVCSPEDQLTADRVNCQLAGYLTGQLRSFDVPWLFCSGTLFRQRIWRAISMIPYGQVISYAKLAAQAGSPKAFRAAGQAAHCNPIPLILPCHRVVGADGALTGFGGGLELKKNLLLLEGIPLEKRNGAFYIAS